LSSIQEYDPEGSYIMEIGEFRIESVSLGRYWPNPSVTRVDAADVPPGDKHDFHSTKQSSCRLIIRIHFMP